MNIQIPAPSNFLVLLEVNSKSSLLTVSNLLTKVTIDIAFSKDEQLIKIIRAANKIVGVDLVKFEK
jgi:hypothetical protein